MSIDSPSPSSHRRNQILAGVGVSVLLLCVVSVPVVFMAVAAMSIMGSDPDIGGATVFLLSLGIVIVGIVSLKLLRPWCLSRRWDTAWRTLAWLSPVWLSPAVWMLLLSLTFTE